MSKINHEVNKNNLIKTPSLTENLDRSFQILNMILELKLSLYCSLYPEQSQKDLEKKINREMVERKVKQWKSLQI
jgi:hypothetical protein